MYGGPSQFEGGGFMPSQATQTTADHSSAPTKNRDSNTLVPLTVKQISEAFQSSDDKTNFVIDGVDINSVKVVGIVFNKVDRTTDVSFVVDDGTGCINCSRWIHEELDFKEMAAISNGMYVRVHGNLKGFQGRKQLMVFSVRPVDDHNEIAGHFADVIYVHAYNRRLPKPQDSSGVLVQVPGSATTNPPSKGYQASPSTHASPVPGYNTDKIDGIHKMVMDYLLQPHVIGDGGMGAHVKDIAKQLNVAQQQILEAIHDLESEGIVYSTIDSYHFKSTGNG